MVCCGHWSLGRTGIGITKFLQKINNVLALTDEDTVRELSNLEAEKEFQFSHHAHLKLLGHHISELLA